MKKFILISMMCFLVLGIKAQTIVPAPDSTKIIPAQADARSIGWSGGRDYSITNVEWPEFQSPCIFYGFNERLVGVINAYNTTPPNTSCTGMNDVVFHPSTSNLAIGLVRFRGTTRLRYVTNTGLSAVATVSTRVTIDFNEQVYNYNGQLLVRADHDANINVLFEMVGPTNGMYDAGGGGVWTPAINLYNNLHTYSGASICTSFDPGNFYSYAVNDSAFVEPDMVFETGDTFVLSSFDDPLHSYVKTGPLGFNSTQGKDTIEFATEFMTGDYYYEITDEYGCKLFDTTSVQVLTCNTYDTVNTILCGVYTSPSGKEFTTLGTHYDTIPNLELCDSLITINLFLDTIKPQIANNPQDLEFGYCDSVVTYSLTGVSDNCGTYDIALVSGIASGSAFPVGTTTNVLSITDMIGNSINVSFNVTIKPKYLPTTFPDLQFCVSDPVYDLSKGESDLAFTGPGVLNDALSFSPAVATTGTHNIDLEFTDSMGCVTPENFSVDVVALPTPEIERVASDKLYVKQSYSAYLWFKDGEVIPGATDRLYKVNAVGVYTVRAENEAGCLNYSSPYGFGVSLAVEDFLLIHEKLTVYPNPASAQLLIEFGDLPNGPKTIVVYDRMGHEIHRASTEEAIAFIDLTTFAQGTYTLRIESKGKINVVPFVKI